ncbi:hypothetical protein GCM10009548_84220 [Streptomyces malaysiensis subsp. malaysiensis]|nr:hypothetical protein [Streptomyces solisilvae]
MGPCGQAFGRVGVGGLVPVRQQLAPGGPLAADRAGAHLRPAAEFGGGPVPDDADERERPYARRGDASAGGRSVGAGHRDAPIDARDGTPINAPPRALIDLPTHARIGLPPHVPISTPTDVPSDIPIDAPINAAANTPIEPAPDKRPERQRLCGTRGDGPFGRGVGGVGVEGEGKGEGGGARDADRGCQVCTHD